MTADNGAHRQLTARTPAFVLRSRVLRTLILISGGAVVAMLTFVGNLWTRDDELSCETLLGMAIQFC
jgi:hypothetical protein